MHVHLDENSKHRGKMRLRVELDPASVQVTESLIGVRVDMRGGHLADPPGAPSLPTVFVRCALPKGQVATAVTVRALQEAALSPPVALAPIQQLRPGARRRDVPYRRKDDERRPQRRCAPAEETCIVDMLAADVPPYVPPDEALYAALPSQPAARLIDNEVFGITPVAQLALRPVRMAEDGQLVVASVIDIEIALDAGRDPGDEAPAHILSHEQALRDIALTKAIVVNPRDVIDFSHRFPIERFMRADYVIITDNNRWDPASRTVLGGVGSDMVASFERLAQWKRQRGLKVALVTVTDIVEGTYGDFVSGSRDLPETIRNFLKMAYSKWGTAWVLLGGDTSIIPPRYVAGGVGGTFEIKTADPPEANEAAWSGDHLRIHTKSIFDRWGAIADYKVIRYDDGRLIPFDATGASSTTVAGWYFTTDNSYATRSAVETDFVRVNGPAALVNGPLQVLGVSNTIPTDFYYASLVGEAYGIAGRHDWDTNDNEVYGKWTTASSLGGINYWATVSVGRVPAMSAAQADAFVSKLIAYEKFEAPDGTDLDPAWPARTAIASENWDSGWGGRNQYQRTLTDPPAEYFYFHGDGSDHALIKLAAVPDWNWSLLSVVGETDIRVLPYRTDAKAAGRGWHFATSPTDLSPNGMIINSGSFITWLPLPSQWVVAYGPENEVAPSRFIFNYAALDGSAVDQEELRRQLALGTGFSPAQRFYEDVQDMTPTQIAAAPLQILTNANLTTALQAGPHVVSLSGHGNFDYCCHLFPWTMSGLTNGFHTFVAYADSCLTARYDVWCLGAAAVTAPGGGAIGYLGNSRYSWVGLGDDFQRRFFEEWAVLGPDARLGLLNDTRVELRDIHGQYSRWTTLAMHLLGCPETPLLWRKPNRLMLPPLQFDHRIKFKIIDPNPPDPPFNEENPYLIDRDFTRVHVMQGDRNETFIMRGNAIDQPLTGFKAGPATVTISRPGYRPEIRKVDIAGNRSHLVWWIMVVVLILTLLITTLASVLAN